MDRQQFLSPDIAKVLTTEEFVAYAEQEVVKAYVDLKMQEGQEGKRHGWVMSEIVSDVKERYGEAPATYARQYIIKDVCKIKTPLKSEVRSDFKYRAKRLTK